MIDKILKPSNNLAYICDDESITYKKLYEKVDEYGTLLQKQGNTPVIIYGKKSVDYLIMILSCIKAKRCYIPLNDTIPIYRIKEIINLSKATTILTNEKLDISNINILNLESLKLYNKNKKVPNKNKICYIIFTSGSIGTPKGVPISYDNLMNFINWINKLIPPKNINKVYNSSLFSFDLSVTDLYYSLSNNLTLVSNVKKDMYDSLKDINLMVVTPSHLKLCLTNPDFNELNYPKLKYIYSCGERLDVNIAKEIYNRFKQVKLINAYGPTEATSAVCGILITNEMLNNKYLPVGDISNVATKLEIIDGEIVLSGKSVLKNYLNDSKPILKYYTNDLGYIENNLIYCLGRKDYQVKFMGYRIELGDIENNFFKIPGISEAVVVPVYYKDNIKMFKAFIVSDIENIDYIKNELAKYIPKYMIPKKIEILKQMPLTNNLKIDRSRLK